MQDEILNIDHHVRLMVLRALNLTGCNKRAATMLGISVRTLFRYRVRFGITFDAAAGKFLIPDKPAKNEHHIRQPQKSPQVAQHLPG